MDSRSTHAVLLRLDAIEGQLTKITAVLDEMTRIIAELVERVSRGPESP